MPALQVVAVHGRAAWRRWLARNGTRSPGVWLVFPKKGFAGAGVPYEEAVEEALCFGWIDSLVKRRDEATCLRKFTPRRRGSSWSATNLARWEKVTREGRVTAAGRAVAPGPSAKREAAALERARKCDAVPGWLTRALRPDAAAFAAFGALPPSYRRNLVRWIADAKREETRARRIAEAAARLRSGTPLGLK